MGKGIPEGPGRFIGPSGRSGTSRGPSEGPGGFVGPLGRSGKGRGTILEVRDGSGDPG